MDSLTPPDTITHELGKHRRAAGLSLAPLWHSVKCYDASKGPTGPSVTSWEPAHPPPA